jgi:hypothetical protein
VVALNLNALQGDNPCPNGGMDCSNDTLNLSPTLAEFGSESCSISVCEFGGFSVRIRFVVAPEPSTWAMMVVGFVGLGLVGYRSNRQAAGRNDGISGTPEKVAA